jgi:hypothetical protein
MRLHRRIYWSCWSLALHAAWHLFGWCDAHAIPGHRARLWIWRNL